MDQRNQPGRRISQRMRLSLAAAGTLFALVAVEHPAHAATRAALAAGTAAPAVPAAGTRTSPAITSAVVPGRRHR
jgi:hypothetical protein